MTLAGALLTKLSLLNFFMTEARKPCWYFSSSWSLASSSSTLIILPNGTAYSVVRTRKEAEPAAFSSVRMIDDKLHILAITALKWSLCSPNTCNSNASLFGIFFWRRIVRTPPTISFAISKSSRYKLSTGATSGISATIKLSPSLRGSNACHNSSVIKGINGWSRRSRASKKPSVDK